ncbi:hypothetical protein IT087_02020 [Candidatus Uhrbacteria bacterium]|nr:hypothetical protein [Candidatus Uhrbacteria bacterium]
MIFLFDANRHLLAEIGLQDGALRQLVLTGAGERELEAFVSHWQTRGIPVMHSMEATKPDGSHEVATYFSYVQPREKGFGVALEKWAKERGFCPMDVPDYLLPLWECLARLPLEDSERFAMLLAIRLSPREALAEWKSALDESEMAWQKEHERSRTVLEKINSKMGGELAKPFAKV